MIIDPLKVTDQEYRKVYWHKVAGPTGGGGVSYTS